MLWCLALSSRVKGFIYDPEGHDLDIIKYLPDGCHPRNSIRGFWKYVRELRNTIMRSKIALAAQVARWQGQGVYRRGAATGQAARF